MVQVTTATPTKRKAKTIEEQIAALRDKAAWKLIRKAEKLEAKAAQLRKDAAELQEAD